MGRKLKFIISDLHLGAGHSSEAHNPLEDFTATQEFVAFLHQITQESERNQSEVELIFNGDLFEFLQVPAAEQFEPTATYPSQAYLDSSEEASIQRLKLIVQGHTTIFDALADFMHVEEPQRRITVIKGNHDVVLFWPGVKSYLREVLGASGTRASLLRFADEFVSRERIYVEHGHQRAEKMNGYHDSFDPRSVIDPSQLYYPAGSRFYISFLNKVEPQLPFVDFVKPLTTLIWYAFEWDFDFACRALAQFIRHTSALVVSEADKDTVTTSDHLLHDLEDETIRASLAKNYRYDPVFRRSFHERIHNYLVDAGMNKKRFDVLATPEISDNAVLMGQVCQQYQRALLRRAAEEITEQEKAQVILFGHTHEPTQERLPNGSLYINTGSWITDLSQAPPETWSKLFAGDTALGAIRPCLAYARIAYDEADNPHGQLLYFGSDAAKPQGSSETARASDIEETATQTFFTRSMHWFVRFLGRQRLTNDA